MNILEFVAVDTDLAKDITDITRFFDDVAYDCAKKLEFSSPVDLLHRAMTLANESETRIMKIMSDNAKDSVVFFTDDKGVHTLGELLSKVSNGVPFPEAITAVLSSVNDSHRHESTTDNSPRHESTVDNSHRQELTFDGLKAMFEKEYRLRLETEACLEKEKLERMRLEQELHACKKALERKQVSLQCEEECKERAKAIRLENEKKREALQIKNILDAEFRKRQEQLKAEIHDSVKSELVLLFKEEYMSKNEFSQRMKNLLG